MAHGLSCSAACGVFPDQGSNPCPLHWQADSQPLHHQGSPRRVKILIVPETPEHFQLIASTSSQIVQIKKEEIQMTLNNLSVREFQRGKLICNEAHGAPPAHPPSQPQFIQNSTLRRWISEKPQASLFHPGLCQGILQQQTPLSLPKLPMFPNGTLASATFSNCWKTWVLCFTEHYSKWLGTPRATSIKNKLKKRMEEDTEGYQNPLKPILISFEAQTYRSSWIHS